MEGRQTTTNSGCLQVNGGCLSDVLESRKGNVDEDEKIKNISLESARGLEQRIIHRDIAARNASPVAKISDFGMSRNGDFYEMSKGHKKVPLKWIAPEGMVAHIQNGCLLIPHSALGNFFEGDEPYKEMTSIEIKRMVCF